MTSEWRLLWASMKQTNGEELTAATDIIGELPLQDAYFSKTINSPGAIGGTIPLDPFGPSALDRQIPIYPDTWYGPADSPGAAVFVTRPATQAEAETLAQNMFSPASFGTAKTAIYLERDGVILKGGVLWGIQVNVSTDSLSFTGEGFWSYLRRRTIQASTEDFFHGVDQDSIARSLINRSGTYGGGDIDLITIPPNNHGVVRDRSYYWHENKTVGEAIEQLAAVEDGFEFDIVSAYDTGGTIRNSFVTRYPTSGRATEHVFEVGVNVAIANYLEDGTSVVNQHRAFGAGFGNEVETHTESNSASIVSYPLLEGTSTHPDVIRPATLIEHAQRAIARGSQPATQITLEVFPDTIPALGSYEVGDRVAVTASRGYIQLDRAEYKIVSHEVALSIAQGEQSIVTLSPLGVFVAAAAVEAPEAPDPEVHTTTFRSMTDPASKTPAVTPSAADIEHASGGTIYAGGSGTTHNVTTSGEWTTAVAAAAPGDIIDITAVITTQLTYRGNKYGISGGSAADGTDGNPIVIRCTGSGKIDVASLTTTVGALSVYNADHIWCVGVVTEGSQFGVVYRDVEGTASNPIRIAHCSISDTGHACLVIAGWWQLITSSGGTPPAGTGNEWGFSKHLIIEDNTITGPGQTAAQFGECIYLGHGGSPGWISYAQDVLIRHNVLEDCGADYVDIKPGCSEIDVFDNIMRLGHFVFGAAIQCLYVSSGIGTRPAWYDYDPQVRIEGNRIYDGDLTNTDGSSSHYAVQVSLCGVNFSNNLVWGFDNGAIGFRLRSEIAATHSQSSDGEIWTVTQNTFWLDTGFSNVGSNEPGLTAFSSGLYDVRNNLGPSGGAGVDFTATASDFIDPAAIPTVDTVDADAIWETAYGPGSAFDLDLGSTLIDTADSMSGVALAFGDDITQRAVPTTGGDPGAFQHWT